MTRALRLGLFICATLLILGAGVFLIGSKKFLFHRTYRIQAEFPTVTGLNDGADVRVVGIRRGIVSRIVLPNRPDGQVTVVMELDSSTRGVVRKDSVAFIRSEGLLGDKYVEISLGSVDAPGLADGQSIKSEPPLDVSDLIKKTNEILDSARTAMQNVQGTSDNLKSISAKIDRGQGSVGALINDKSLYKQAAAGATAFQEDMEALKRNFLLRGFFRSRGYEDSSELTEHAVSQLPGGRSLKTFSYDVKSLFDGLDTAKLKSPKSLNEAGHYLEQSGFRLAVVAASMGAKGDSEKGAELTRARAFVVRHYLVQNFRLDDSRIKTITLGKSESANDSGRVSIIIYPPSPTFESAEQGKGAK